MINLNAMTDYIYLGVVDDDNRVAWFVAKYRGKFRPMAADFYLAVF